MHRAALTKFVIAMLLLLALFIRPLYRLVEFALHSDLYSHILLIPFVSGYLAASKKRELARCEPAPSGGWGIAAVALGVIPLALGIVAPGWGLRLAVQDGLFLSMTSLVLLGTAVALFVFGRRCIATIALPVAMLFFLAPFPLGFEMAIEGFFQKFSADAAEIFLELSRTPFVRDGLFFHLPGISLEVARECSGIRSSLVLFITALIAGYLFLRSPWRRTLLALAVIPLAILRNGLRIFTISMLCVHIDPAMIHSWVHTKGGPLFFLISLVPFFALLWCLRFSERGKTPSVLADIGRVPPRAPG